MLTLSIQKSSGEVMKHPLTKDTTTVGRSSQNDVCLPDASISRMHLKIVRQGQKYMATDTSTNGTYINGDLISSHALQTDDVIKLGEWTIKVTLLEDNEFEDQPTQIIRKDPTRVLSYNPMKNELVFERAHIQIDEGPDQNRPPFIIKQPSISIGKEENNDIVLTDSFISSFHCKIEFKRGGYYLKDLNSTNGTLLNGQRVMDAALPFGSTIEMGRTKFRFFSAEEIQPLEASKQSQFEGILSTNEKMQKVFGLIERVANSSTTVLIQGETGSGKELVARAVHQRSGRTRKPFIAINCGAISKDLIESELFGHEKGAFTSAHQMRKGVFEQASGGTLFLDEIGELPLDLQPKLLRVLETSEIKRVGGTQLIEVDTRVVAATHRNLPEEVKKGKFREDLYFRIYVVPISIPPLRERLEDVPLLTNHFLQQEFTSTSDKKTLDSSALEALSSYHWPGNIRELKNVISRAVLNAQTPSIGSGDIQFTPLGAKDDTNYEFDEENSPPSTVTRTLKDVERAKIIFELKKNKWNKSATANALGIAKSTLHEKIKKYEITEEK